jgi:hypothetical protein
MKDKSTKKTQPKEVTNMPKPQSIIQRFVERKNNSFIFSNNLRTAQDRRLRGFYNKTESEKK